MALSHRTFLLMTFFASGCSRNPQDTAAFVVESQELPGQKATYSIDLRVLDADGIPVKNAAVTAIPALKSGKPIRTKESFQGAPTDASGYSVLTLDYAPARDSLLTLNIVHPAIGSIQGMVNWDELVSNKGELDPDEPKLDIQTQSGIGMTQWRSEARAASRILIQRYPGVGRREQMRIVTELKLSRDEAIAELLELLSDYTHPERPSLLLLLSQLAPEEYRGNLDAVNRERVENILTIQMVRRSQGHRTGGYQKALEKLKPIDLPELIWVTDRLGDDIREARAAGNSDRASSLQSIRRSVETTIARLRATGDGSVTETRSDNLESAGDDTAAAAIERNENGMLFVENGKVRKLKNPGRDPGGKK